MFKDSEFSTEAGFYSKKGENASVRMVWLLCDKLCGTECIIFSMRVASCSKVAPLEQPIVVAVVAARNQSCSKIIEKNLGAIISHETVLKTAKLEHQAHDLPVDIEFVHFRGTLTTLPTVNF